MLFDIFAVFFSSLSCMCFVAFVILLCMSVSASDKLHEVFIVLYVLFWMIAFVLAFFGVSIISVIAAFSPIALFIVITMCGLLWMAFSKN